MKGAKRPWPKIPISRPRSWLFWHPRSRFFATDTGCAELQKSQKNTSEQAAEEAKQNRIRTLDLDQPIASLSVEAIADELEANSVMAENKYMNQPVELIGFIGSIDDSLFDEKNVSITITAGEYSFSSVSCSKPRSAPEVSECAKACVLLYAAS